MAGSVVEVVVRFGATLVEVVRVGPGETFALPWHSTVRLVVDGMIRVPSLQVGLATIEVTRCVAATERVERPGVQLRLAAFVLASLVVHLGVWLYAMLFEPFERLVETQRPRLRHVHVAQMDEPAPEPSPRAEVQPPAPAVTRAKAPASRRETGVEQRRATNAAAAAAEVAAIVENTRVVERVGALRPEDTYNEDDANSRGFGGSPRFPPGETIKTGEGYELMTYDVRLCPAKSCKVTGPVPPAFVRAQLHEHMTAIYACYTKHASGAGTIVLEFTIAGDGSVRDARGSGLGETGACAARVLPQIYFKAIGDNDVADGKPRTTRVRYPIEFR